MHAGLQTVPFRTPTLPPATHTNTWIVGDGDLTVIDPASPWEDEQERLLELLLERMDAGERVERLVLTHHHHDHVSGAVRLQADLAEHGVQAPILAHPVTAELLRDEVPVDGTLHGEATVTWGGRRLHLMHTPGHAAGHLVFHDLDAGWMIAGDMVAGIGTILLHPDEGDLQHYLDSLAAMKAAAPRVLLPSHGPDLTRPTALLDMYVAHRHMRTQQIGDALARHGDLTAAEIVPHVYAELETKYHRIAALQIRTHLAWMADHGLAEAVEEGRWRRR